MSVSTAYSAPRFALVGVANFCVSLAVFWVCVHHPPLGTLATAAGARAAPTADAAVANVLAYLAGMVNSFVLNRSWTFRASGSAAAQAVKFVTVNLLCIALTTAVVYVLVDVLRYPEIGVWVPLTAVAVLLNYLGCKHWVFAGPRRYLPRTG
ncbi:MAG TPA: GtrA family protein [Gammaproteobacteria bacterium]